VPADRIVFYDWPFSPFCMKVRALLDYKGVPYERVNPLGPAVLRIYRRGKVGKVPAVDFDGTLVVDSTDIAYEVERRFPHPPLLPADPRERGLCHALEDWADESLYFIGLYYRWYEAEGRKPIPQAFGKSITGRLAYAFYLRRVLRQVKGQGTLRKPPEHVAADLERHLQAVEALLTPGPYLLGGGPYLCDFALWGQLNYLARTPVGKQALAGRAATQAFLDRVRSPGKA
jgi:glutathione S-transferase